MENMIENSRVSRRLESMFSSIRSDSNVSSHQATQESDKSVGENETQEAQNDASVTYHSDIQVTFHKRELFMETFKEYYNDVSVIERSLSPGHNRDQVFKAGEGAGRSGSFFFFSHDRKFIIKTMSKQELDLFLNMLPALSQHYKKNPDSLLAKIFGVFTVKTKATSSVHLMLMENVLQIKNQEGLRYIFDLKGSLVDRKVKGKTKPSTTLKDVNYLMAA